MTLNGVLAVILRYFAEFRRFGPVTSKWYQDTLVLLATEITETKCINERHPFVKGDNLTTVCEYEC